MNKVRIFVDFLPSPEVLEMLRAGTAGHELIFPAKPATSLLEKAERDPQFASAEIAFGQPDLDAITEARRLKWIHISTSSITRYDQPELRALLVERGAALSNSASVYNDACATHALSFILAQARQLPGALASRAVGGSADWYDLRSACRPVHGERAIIVGYGAIGRRLAKMLRPFDMEICGYRRKARGDETVPMVTAAEFGEALAQADHVINILPDNAETHQFFDRARFSGMKTGAIFYNIGRGATVDQEALVDALRSQKIAAAWLDVTEPEPLPNEHPLRAEPNCYITPHVAGGHTGEMKTMVQHFLRNFDRFLRGQPLLDRVV